MKYNHAEAYCLMFYVCTLCGTRLHIWNSRDGVTPMFIRCRECGHTMHHDMSRKDKCDPDYIPYEGQYVFIDIPPNLRPVYARSTVNEAHPNMDAEEKNALVEDMLRWEFEKWAEMAETIGEDGPVVIGEPYLIKFGV